MPAWDAVALLDEYAATGDRVALARAKSAFAFVERSGAYALGACPRVDYQQPGGGTNRLKTLETDSNLIKAALLLYRATREPAYLAAARAHYRAVRAYFLDPSVPLYTVYLFDDGSSCAAAPTSVLRLGQRQHDLERGRALRDTRARSYLDQAVATARAVDRRLSDGRGVFADLQAENDVVEPLVEGMDVLALRGEAFARSWILRNAAAALSARAGDGSFGRFFDGPPPVSTVTAWQTNGGLSLEIAAAALAPGRVVPTTRAWARAATVSHEIAAVPATLVVHGAGVALSARSASSAARPVTRACWSTGARPSTGPASGRTSRASGGSIDGTVLFAWRWRSAGTHTLTFQPGGENAKEGGPFLHVRAYELLTATG